MESNVLFTYYFGWWQLVTCLIAFLGLMAIWWHLGRRQKDTGQVFLALSVLCWSLSGAIEVYFSSDFQPISLDRQPLLNGWRSIFSLLNSLFILLALPWFKYLPERIAQVINSKFWSLIVGLPFLFCLVPTVTSIFNNRSMAAISELDVYYAFLTLGFLGVVIWQSFIKRNLMLLAWISALLIVFTFVAQIFKLSNSEFDRILLSAIFKTSLIMIFFALALSWVKDLAVRVMPHSASEFMMRFLSEKNEKGKSVNLVSIAGFPEKGLQRISLTPGNFHLLKKFAITRADDEDGWLEIKPKSDTRHLTYDIKDYNEVKRIMEGILDGVFGKGNWMKDKHYLPFKSIFFEMSEDRTRKIRLALPPENISFS